MIRCKGIPTTANLDARAPINELIILLYKVSCTRFYKVGLASNRPTLMPSQTDLFRTLPPNVRQCVYSYLFLNDGDCTVKIESKSPPNDWLSTVLALSEDPLYVTHYRGRIGNPKWPKEVDEAFFQGMYVKG